MPIKPPLSEALSALFIHECGNVKSKAPKNEAAKTTRSTKNAILK